MMDLASQKLIGYIFILGTVLFTVYGQIVIKWQVGILGAIPSDSDARIGYLIRLMLNPWVISSLTAAFLAFLCWVGAMTKFDLSYAYPFTSASFVLVLVLSAMVFREQITLPKMVGLGLIIAGIIFASRG
jgi:multidrug transporter EmrE-like cation transporter